MKLRTIALQSKLRLTTLATRMRVVVGEFISAVLGLDSISTSDAVNKQARLPKTESISTTDQAVVVPNKRRSETVKISDTGAQYFAGDYVTGAPLSQTYTVSGGMFSWRMSKVLSEAPSITDSIVKTLPHKIFTETVNVTDDVNGAAAGDDQTFQYFKLTTNLVSLSDAINSKRIGKSVSESPRVTDVISKALPSKVFNNSTSTTDIRVVRYSKRVSEACGVADTINSRRVGKVVAETPVVSSSGLLRAQNYTVNMTYFAEDYVGSSRAFS